ncbi:hypothetical protein WJX84_011683 [Apatococcus fuscideae]|uniref:Uncharacterized protein n=1 Tax=Apatococcus fuscideae TaxID=2026836 RepID=A0AAW1SSL0_9CHLO
MAELSPTTLFAEPWTPASHPRTRTWHTSRGRSQPHRESDSVSAFHHLPKSQPLQFEQPLAALSLQQQTALQLFPETPIGTGELGTTSQLLGNFTDQPKQACNSEHEAAAWRRSRRGRRSAASLPQSGSSEELPKSGETEQERHLYSAAADWDGRYQKQTRLYQRTARSSAEWTPWQCLAGSFREEQPVQASRQLLFTRQTDDGTDALEHLSVTTGGAEEGSRLRPDGNFEHAWYTSLQANQEADGFCQEVPHTTGPLRRRALAASPDELASVHMALPLPQSLQSLNGRRALRSADYSLGLTFHDQDGRSWSIAAQYSMDTRQLLGLRTERDFAMGEAAPSQAVNFAELSTRGIQPAGPRLDGRSASWLAGRWRGTATSLTFDEDGNIWRHKKHDCIWTPPNNHRREFLYGLWTLPDSCYVFGPLQMPGHERSIPTEGVRLEFGVKSSSSELRRAVILYDARGRLGKILFEQYERQTSEASPTHWMAATH